MASEAGADDASLPTATDNTPSDGHTWPAGHISRVPDVVTDFGGLDDGAPHADAPTTSHIGRYALKGLLGQGGLGQVHEAWDPLLKRTVAIKTLQFSGDQQGRGSLDAVFLNEARAAAGLTHAHIVTVYDAGLSARGVYITMERLRGVDLRQRLIDGWQPTPAQAALLVRRVADALGYAHACGVVHCDVKPANIFLNRRDKPKVLDFGIARVAQGGDPTVPLDGPVAGSPHYLAPEQLQRGRVDARTDVHALGVVFYELLTGRKAYEGDTFEKITQALMHSQPPPAHEFRPGVPLALSNIAAKAMAHDPADRYRTAGDFSRDLRRWLDTQPQPARPRSAVAAPDVDDEAPPVPAPAASRRPAHLAALLLLLASAAALMLVAARR